MPNSCEFGTRGEEVEEEDGELDDLLVKDVEQLKKDPQTCFFENQHQAHGSRWTPNYDKCFSCSCQVTTAKAAAAVDREVFGCRFLNVKPSSVPTEADRHLRPAHLSGPDLLQDRPALGQVLPRL